MPGHPCHKALYYPHVEFGSLAWVKSALLYWDGIARIIVQAGPHDDPEIQELVDAKLVETIEAVPFRPEVDRLFGERLEDLLRQRGGLPSAIPHTRELRGLSPDQLAAGVEEVAQHVEAQGFGLAARAMRVAPGQVMTLYVAVAAEVIARERGLAPFSDDPMFAAIDTYFRATKVVLDPKGVPAGLVAANLLVPTPSVEAVASLPVGRLLELRAKLAKERRAFRRKVESHAESIARLPSLEAVRDHLSAFAAEIRGDLEGQREVIRAANVKDTWSLLSVTAPASVAVGTAVAQSFIPVLGPISGAAVLALRVTSWFFHPRKPHDGREHYMLALQNGLRDRSLGLEAGLNKLLAHSVPSLKFAA
jgi:hypothetical protein